VSAQAMKPGVASHTRRRFESSRLHTAARPILMSATIAHFLVLAVMVMHPHCSPRVEVSHAIPAPRVAQAVQPGCLVQLSPRWRTWPHPMLCSILVHEVGHLAGRRHSTNPHSVMYPVYLHPYWRCAKVT
jgi:hypothetical protein